VASCQKKEVFLEKHGFQEDEGQSAAIFDGHIPVKGVEVIFHFQQPQVEAP
jgi:hypothetical protein